MKEVKEKKFCGIPAEAFIAYASNHTCKEIAEHFDQHSTNIYSILAIHSIPYKKMYSRKAGRDVEFTPDDKQMLYGMIRTLSETYTQKSIARILGYSEAWVSKICSSGSGTTHRNRKGGLK